MGIKVKTKRTAKRSAAALTAAFLALVFLLTALGASAAEALSGTEASGEKVIQTVRALGIMIGDEAGNMNLSDLVTRAQICKMMVVASPYKDSVSEGGNGFSLFRDLKSGHWASQYVKLAVDAGWIIGYTDGTFRPDNPVTLEEACTIVLRVIGFNSASLTGTYPTAQLNKAASLGLRDGVAAKQGDALTRNDCARLFYNLLTVKTASGQYYASVLGYSVVNGEVDTLSVINRDIEGPFIAGTDGELPFAPQTVYLDGKVSAVRRLSKNDVYYYNTNVRTFWICTEKVSGKITALTPSETAPSGVTVSGITYPIGSADAAYALSSISGSAKGSFVTLLLGMNGEVVGVLENEKTNTAYYGVIRGYSDGIDGIGSAAKTVTTVSVLCTDGVLRSFPLEKRLDEDEDDIFSAGDMVSVTVSAAGTTVRKPEGKTLKGKVATGEGSGTAVGNRKLSENVRILDTDFSGGAVGIDVSRIAGCMLDSGNVRFYAENEKGEITDLILRKMTGDTESYLYITGITETQESVLSAEQSAQMMLMQAASRMLTQAVEQFLPSAADIIEAMTTGTEIPTITVYNYSYLASGFPGTLPTVKKLPIFEECAVSLSTGDDGVTPSAKKLASFAAEKIDGIAASGEGRSVRLSDSVQIYLLDGDVYYPVSVTKLDPAVQKITVWYDDFGFAAGGLARIIVAEAIG